MALFIVSFGIFAALHFAITQSVLARYETGKLEPNIEILGILADFYGVSVDWLLGTKGENKKN